MYTFLIETEASLFYEVVDCSDCCGKPLADETFWMNKQAKFEVLPKIKVLKYLQFKRKSINIYKSCRGLKIYISFAWHFQNLLLHKCLQFFHRIPFIDERT